MSKLDGLNSKEIQEALYLSRNSRADSVHDALKLMSKVKFNKDDILIKKESSWNWSSDDPYQEWKVEKFSSANDAPRKYKVVHVDEYGLAYVQKVGMKGDTIGDLKCLAGFDPEHTRFEYDPDFIDHQILAEEEDEFDPQEVYKEKRSEYFKTARQT